MLKVGHLDPVDALNRLDPVEGQIDLSEVRKADGERLLRMVRLWLLSDEEIGT